MKKIIKKIYIRIKHIFNNFIYKSYIFSLSLKKRKVIRYKKLLKSERYSFHKYENVLFVFQFFNKRKTCKKLLNIFIEKKVKNIVAFADGCIDGTAAELHKTMRGENHLVIQCNDVHEIKNYRMSLDLAKSLDCEYVLLMQDDDIYKTSIFEWIENAIKISKKFKASIVSGKSGMNLCSDFKYKKTDKSISKEEFKTFRDKKGDLYYQLGLSEKGKLINLKKTKDASLFAFAACVFRAPQLVDISIAKKLGFFPKELEPYQYDDYFNCFISWVNGYKVILAPYSELNSLGVGGMRLYNSVNVFNRPEFFAENWNKIIQLFGNDINNGSIQKLVDSENKKLNIEI